MAGTVSEKGEDTAVHTEKSMAIARKCGKVYMHVDS